jgi:hypothetical protein
VADRRRLPVASVDNRLYPSTPVHPRTRWSSLDAIWNVGSGRRCLPAPAPDADKEHRHGRPSPVAAPRGSCHDTRRRGHRGDRGPSGSQTTPANRRTRRGTRCRARSRDELRVGSTATPTASALSVWGAGASPPCGSTSAAPSSVRGRSRWRPVRLRQAPARSGRAVHGGAPVAPAWNSSRRVAVVDRDWPYHPSTRRGASRWPCQVPGPSTRRNVRCRSSPGRGSAPDGASRRR